VTFNKKDKCDGSGSCADKGTETCNDGNICTDDSCHSFNGCITTNNTAVYDSDCYTGPGGTKGKGLCHGGTEYCQGGSKSGSCIGQVTPVSETGNCDGKDNDCDNSIDEGVKTTYYKDADGDGYGNPFKTVNACSAPPGYVP
jgi:hypothetical protein